jgi:hypothetical protein
MSDVTYERLPVRVGGVDLSVAMAHRTGVRRRVEDLNPGGYR